MNAPGALFVGLSAQLLGQGQAVRFRAAGTSMRPAIQDGDRLTIAPVDPASIKRGDIILFHHADRPIVHRVVDVRRASDGRILVIARGDGKMGDDAPIELSRILGRVVAIGPPDERGPIGIRRAVTRLPGCVLRLIGDRQRIVRSSLRRLCGRFVTRVP